MKKEIKKSDTDIFIESIGFAALMLVTAIAIITALYMVAAALFLLISLLTGVPLP